ncbi:hypothetical protein, partial [Agriterribacter sp.]|uniref:hypothetical protein n=1 Tax=Agriterribacter sp. TaxID=2821509 RepID=UPI002B91D84E
MSGAWDDMLQYEREHAAGISSVAGLAALRAGARRAGLEYGQSRPEDADSENGKSVVSGPWLGRKPVVVQDAAHG